MAQGLVNDQNEQGFDSFLGCYGLQKDADVGDSRWLVEIPDSDGKRVEHFEVRGRWPVVLGRLDQEVPR